MDLELYNKFAEVAELNNINYQQRREPDLHFIECEITRACWDRVWWLPFIGVRFLGIAVYDNYKMKLRNDGIIIIKEIYPVKVTGNTFITKGRQIPATDVKIL